MFTGIVEEIGTIRALQRLADGLNVTVGCETVTSDLKVGNSVSVNGVCLTVVSHNGHSFVADVVSETLQRSTLKDVRVGDPVNLERPLRPNDRFGGHFVQGHIDGTGKVIHTERRLPGIWLTIEIAANFERYIVEKGSIAINGVSLTVADLGRNRFSVAIIPHTAQVTTLGTLRVGDYVNIETDMLGKYVERFVTPIQESSGLTTKRLEELGF